MPQEKRPEEKRTHLQTANGRFSWQDDEYGRPHPLQFILFSKQ